MRWFEGNIVEAITKTKSRGAIFVVYIEGKDEKSNSITQLINNEEISTKLENEAFVAIKIEANSLSHQQFSEIYKTTQIPSIYFIGKQGTPLEIITEAKDAGTLSQNIDSILSKANIKIATPSKKESENLIANEQASSAPPPDVVCENGVCTVKPKIISDTTNAASSSSKSDKTGEDLTPEEKVEKAKQLIEKKRLEKQKEEEEQQRLKEIERRKMGQNVQQLKKWQEDQELKQLVEERERDKRERQAARDRVLAQIAQDKAERAAKFSPPQAQPILKTVPITKPPTMNSNVSRIQFKFPDGRSSTNDFASSDLLEAVHAHVRNNLNLTFSHYILARTFPRHEFTDEDKLKTLLDLQLVPTAVLLILPVNRGVVSSNSGPGGSVSFIFWTLVTPFLNIFGYLKSFIFGGGRIEPSPNSNPIPETSTEYLRSQPKARPGETSVIKRHGNVHRLSDTRDDDDENNTWNGNSTQQM